MTENGFEYVDLGLPSGTMWATCNVGATKTEDEGLLFQFGRVDGYKYKDRNNKFTKYDISTTSGKVYKAGDILELEDDVAHIHMGGKWRMPTGSYNLSEEYNGDWGELINNTTYEVETINGVKGMMFTSKINNNQLFIPFVQGYWYNGTWYDLNGSCAIMLSSQVHDSNIDYAYGFHTDLSDITYIGSNYRTNAFSVRGVFRK